MVEPEHRLQVLIANEQHERLENITAIVEGLGHEIVARDVSIGDIGPLSRSTGAEVALVGLGIDGEHALEQISQIVHEAACPVIALIDADDPSYVQKSGPAWCLCVCRSRRRGSRRAARRSRHHTPEICGVPEPAGCVRTPGGHRTSEGHPHGAAPHRRRRRLCSAEVALTAERPEAQRRGTGDYADPSASSVRTTRPSVAIECLLRGACVRASLTGRLARDAPAGFPWRDEDIRPIRVRGHPSA